MTWLRTIVSQLIALFVDDGVFAAALIIWLALIAFLLPQIGVATGVWRGFLLFIGFAVILIESVARRSKAP